MGQLFNRIGRMVRSEFNGRESHGSEYGYIDVDAILGSNDDELRRMIDELPKPGLSLPEDVRDACVVLDISLQGAEKLTSADIAKAYSRMMQLWHPDRFDNADAATRATSLERTREIQAAYILLKAYYG